MQRNTYKAGSKYYLIGSLIIVVLLLPMCRNNNSFYSESMVEYNNSIWTLISSTNTEEEYFRLKLSKDTITILFEMSDYRHFPSKILSERKLNMNDTEYYATLSGNQMILTNMRDTSEQLFFEQIDPVLDNFKVTTDFIVSKYNFGLNNLKEPDSLLVDSLKQRLLDKILGNINSFNFQ